MERDNGFLWGVAISAYQAEGGYNQPGEPQTNWAPAERSQQVEPLGRSADFWRHYRDDFAACRRLGLSAFRLGIEWSRVQPITDPSLREPPAFDQEAIDQYARILAACLDQGLEPIVTLHHFVHPAWLGPDPWLDDGIESRFIAYVRRVVTGINRHLVAGGRRPVRYFITINEPNMLVMNTYLGRQFPSQSQRGLRRALVAMNHLLRAHVRAYNLLHDLYADEGWGEVRVSLNNYTSDIYWLDQAWIDLLHAREYGIRLNEVTTWLRGRAQAFRRRATESPPADMAWASQWLGRALRRFADGLACSLADDAALRPALDGLFEGRRDRVLDFLALDYYDPFCAHILKLPAWPGDGSGGSTLNEALIDSLVSKWWDWRVLPEGLRFFCEYYAETYHPKPLLIAENGMAHPRTRANRVEHRRDRILRSTFLELHAREVIAMARAGVPLLGYLHWSLFDNYEWGSYAPRFGLYSLDYEQGTERLSRDHYGDCPSATYARLIREAGFAR